jgi:ABC-type nitrate/sulfonate/bicarbonate transport system permease component
VLVPAELLGVTSGLGYAIKDARETLAYDQLTAMVLTIGSHRLRTGYHLRVADQALQLASRRRLSHE